MILPCDDFCDVIHELTTTNSTAAQLVSNHLHSCGLMNSLISPGQQDRHFLDDIFRCIFVIEKFLIFIIISLKFVAKGPIDNNPALV